MQVNDSNKNRKSTAVLAVVCLVLELALAPNIAIANGHANFAFVFAAIIALTVGGRYAVLSGFLAGLLFDLLTTGPVGLMALLLTASSYLLGVECRNRLADDTANAVVVASCACLLVSAFYNLAMFLVGGVSSIGDALIGRSLPTFLLTMLAFAPFAYVLRRTPAGSGPDLSRLGRHGRSHGGNRYSLGNL